MTGINLFAHKISSSGATSGVAGAQALQGAQTGVFALGAGNFWDMILTRLATSGEQKNSTNTSDLTKTPLQNDNPLTILQVALAAQSLDDDGNIVISSESDQKKLQGQLDLTNKLINHLKNVLPESSEKEGLFKQVLVKLQNKSETLQASLSMLENGIITKDTPVEDIPLPLLISLGLNPAEISTVTEKIQDLEKKLGRDITVEDLIAGVGGILLPPENTTVSILNSLNEQSEPTDEMAKALNALDVGGDGTIKAQNASPENGLPLKSGEEAKILNPNTQKELAEFKNHLTSGINHQNRQSADPMLPVMLDSSETSSTIFHSYGFQANNTLNFGSVAQASSMISSSTIAGQHHPATQLVAATLVRQGKEGSDSTMTLRLDPPELGNVSIRLQFNKGKSVKAHLTIEKPETYMMLQRDVLSLERALQSAGLDTDNNAVTFELAQNNSGEFGSENGGDKGFGGNSAGPQNVSSEDVVYSSISWQVDPSTGHIRYNIFA